MFLLQTRTLSGTKRWWTDGAAKTIEGSAATPVEDMIAMVENARDKGVKGHLR